ncbi:MAG: hypothetical protein DCC55_30630, partial [Chloroflexi bacterium]
PGGGASYTIQPGDTLIGIAARYGVDWTMIAEENQLREETLLQIGQVIRIPGVAGASAQNSSPPAQSVCLGSRSSMASPGKSLAPPMAWVSSTYCRSASS